MSDRDAAGINSIHNACAFRADCRKAEAQLAEKDAEIARLRKILGWVAQEWHDCEICKQLDVKDAEIARMRDVLASKGFIECGIPACDCRSWHHRYGLPERWAEIKEVLIDADVLNNDTGNMPLNAIKKLIAQLAERDAEIAQLERERDEKDRQLAECYDKWQATLRELTEARAEIARLSEDAARYRLTPAVIQCLKRGLNCWPEQNNAEGAEIREILKKAAEVKLRIGEDV